MLIALLLIRAVNLTDLEHSTQCGRYSFLCGHFIFYLNLSLFYDPHLLLQHHSFFLFFADCLTSLRGKKEAKLYAAVKLCSTVNKKEKYVVHYRNLQTNIRHGLRVSKIHWGIQFTQSHHLQKCIDKCSTRLRVFSVFHVPDRTFHNFRASKPVNLWFQIAQISGLWGSELVKYPVGSGFSSLILDLFSNQIPDQLFPSFLDFFIHFLNPRVKL